MNITVAQHIGLAFARKLAYILAIIVVFAIFEENSPVAAEPSPGTPDYLIAQHDCWFGPAPTGKVAYHAVVSYFKNEKLYVGYVDGNLFEKAIDEGVYGKDHKVIDEVHGFCE